ncbi:MAG: DUF5329 domain-containing protein [Methylophilaceae bacterium]
MSDRSVSLIKALRGALVLAILAAVSAYAQAKSLSEPARVEIQQLLSALGNSQCEFYRNGTWHSSVKAKQHIASKLEYLERRELVSSTEDFIALAATKSSKSGEPYQVQCPGKSPEPSATWLERRLKSLRGSPSYEQKRPGR